MRWSIYSCAYAYAYAYARARRVEYLTTEAFNMLGETKHTSTVYTVYSTRMRAAEKYSYSN